MGNSIERLNRRVPRKSLAQPLVVDPECHRAELARFCRHIVVGPDVDDCAIWVGAIGDDGYGRFHVSRNGAIRIVRAHRYALAASLGGVPLEPDIMCLHACDNPVCVRVADETAVHRYGRLLHVTTGTQQQNMEAMARKGRGGGRPNIITRGGGVAARRERSRALRAAVIDGWNVEAVERVLLGNGEWTLW